MPEQLAGFGSPQRRGRFVQNKNARAIVHGARNFNELAFRNGEIADQATDPVWETEIAQPLARARGHGLIVDNRQRPKRSVYRRLAETHILRDRHRIYQLELLVNDDDTLAASGGRVLERDCTALYF